MLELTKENYETEVLKNPLPVIVDFWANWCGPCKMLGPVFEKLSHDASFKDKLKFAKLDVDSNELIAAKSGIRGIPCLIVFSKGKELGRIVGFASDEILKVKIKEILAKI